MILSTNESRASTFLDQSEWTRLLFNKGDNDDLWIFSQYLGRWWLQDKFAQLSDLTGKCRSQVYSVNLVNKTIHRHTDFLTLM